MPEMYVRWDDLKELIEEKPSGIITAEDIKRLERGRRFMRETDEGCERREGTV